MFRQVRADFDQKSVIVYQAYNDAIADAALEAGKLVAPFSLSRMTWIKPSFLWMMERSGWARKPNQERVLAIRLARAPFDDLLSQAVLTHPEPDLYPDADVWRHEMERSRVRVQWDPERNLRGQKLDYRSIQIGIGRELIEAYALRWIVDIRDMTPLARKIKALLRSGEVVEAASHLPKERLYPLSDALVQRLGATR